MPLRFVASLPFEFEPESTSEVISNNGVTRVIWPSAIATHAEVFRVLDLSALTHSVRESRSYIKAKYVYVDGNQISTIRDTVELGKVFRLEIRFPNGIIKAKNVFLTRPVHYKPRLNMPDTEYRKP